MSGQPGAALAHTLADANFGEKIRSDASGGRCSGRLRELGSKGSVQSLCGHKDGARTDGQSLFVPPQPPAYFTQSLLIMWPSHDGSGDLLNICNGRRKKGRKVSLVMATPGNGG